VDLVTTDVLEEHITSIISVERISEVGITLAVADAILHSRYRDSLKSYIFHISLSGSFNNSHVTSSLSNTVQTE
jgi:hypothetical protein